MDKTKFKNKTQESVTGCWLWTGWTHRTGYGGLVFNKKKWQAHRISWILYRGPIGNNLNVLHRCDIRNCVNPDHLFLGTQKENIQDCLKKGRFRGGQTKGHRSHRAKLTEEQVKRLRTMRLQGVAFDRLCEEFKVTRTAVIYAFYGKTYKNIK